MSEPTTPPRRLDDKVLQSAQDAVLTEPLGPTELQREIAGDSGLTTRSRRSYVASHPLAAGLAAACAGALAMVVLRSMMQSRRHPNKVPVRQ